MTDNEIIKALECCISTEKGSCKKLKCPMLKECPTDIKSAEKHALSLINRQKAEISELQHRNSELEAELDDLKRDDLPRCKDALRRANEIGIDLEKENKELKAEVEKLELLNVILLESCAGYSRACDTYKVEIERLQAEVDKQYEIAAANVRAEIASGGTSCHWCEDKVRAEAIKEFAERLIARCGAPHWCVWMGEISEEMEEMVGENNENM